MRKPIVHLALIASILVAGCTGGVEADLKKSGDELQKDAAAMSDSDLDAKMKDLEKYAESLSMKGGDGEPSQDDMEKAMKLIEVTGIYATEMAKRKMK